MTLEGLHRRADCEPFRVGIAIRLSPTGQAHAAILYRIGDEVRALHFCWMHDGRDEIAHHNYLWMEFPLDVSEARSFAAFCFEVGSADAERREPVLVTLEMPPQALPVRITFRGFRYYEGSESSIAEADDGLRFLYEEHSCPVNWLRNLKEVFLGDEEDPHGLFKFVSAQPWTDECSSQLEPPEERRDSGS